MRVIICGGRDFADQILVNAALDAIHAETPITFLWHGNARGADRMAASWGYSHRVKVTGVPADWTRYGKRAGPIRNQNMLGQGIDMVIAFTGGRGTSDMKRRASAAGVKVVEIEGRK